MTRFLSVLMLALGMAIPLAAPHAAAQDDAFLTVAETPGIGASLADAEGMTLYLFSEGATAGASTCYDDCATAWPPVSAGEMLAPPPGIAGVLGKVWYIVPPEMQFGDEPHHGAEDEGVEETEGGTPTSG